MGEMSEELVNEMKQKAQNIQQTVKLVQDIYAYFKKDPDTQSIRDILDKDMQGFSFTGQYTDLCYFQQADRMPLSAIANIQDPQLKKAVIENFDAAIEQKLAKIQDGNLLLTKEGKKLIDTPDFQEAAQAHQIQAYNQNMEKVLNAGLKNGEVQMGAALTGDYMNDFTFYSHADQLDLNTILSHPNRELSAKILGNIKGWADSGLVSVDAKTGIATITEAGKKILANPEFQSLVKPVANKAISSLATGAVGVASAGTGTIIVATAKVLGKAAQLTKTAVQTTSR